MNNIAAGFRTLLLSAFVASPLASADVKTSHSASNELATQLILSYEGGSATANLYGGVLYEWRRNAIQKLGQLGVRSSLTIGALRYVIDNDPDPVATLHAYNAFSHLAIKDSDSYRLLVNDLTKSYSRLLRYWSDSPPIFPWENQSSNKMGRRYQNTNKVTTYDFVLAQAMAVASAEGLSQSMFDIFNDFLIRYQHTLTQTETVTILKKYFFKQVISKDNLNRLLSDVEGSPNHLQLFHYLKIMSYGSLEPDSINSDILAAAFYFESTSGDLSEKAKSIIQRTRQNSGRPEFDQMLVDLLYHPQPWIRSRTAREIAHLVPNDPFRMNRISREVRAHHHAAWPSLQLVFDRLSRERAALINSSKCSEFLGH